MICFKQYNKKLMYWKVKVPGIRRYRLSCLRKLRTPAQRMRRK